MMELEEAYSLLEIFMERAAAKRLEERLTTERQVQFEDDKKKKHEKHVREKEEREQLEALVLASARQMEAFNEQLDSYDTATVQALMDNGTALDDMRHSREILEASAYRLPDGRIVFKTDDGKQVVDRHGVALSPDVIDPRAIPDSLPKWESLKALTEAEEKLERERQEILQFQQRLDATREKVGKGQVTADALADMDAELRRSMPDAVKANLPGAVAAQAAPAVQAAAAPGTYKPPVGMAPVITGP